MQQSLAEFVEKILMEYQDSKESIDEMYEYYGFRTIDSHRTINTTKPGFLFFMLGGCPKVYPCAELSFAKDSYSITTKLAFDSDGRTEVIDIHVQLPEQDYLKFL